jgi:class 3 adenylate cyclase/sugar lactone lactonase YvrE
LITAREPNQTSPGDAGVALLTFLIADVRGYTRFTVERGDEAAAELAMKFAALTREAVTRRSGEVLELRGDEVLAVFSFAEQALRAAVELQGRLVAEIEAEPELPLRAGVGVATGNAVPVEGGFRGVALNLAARLCSLAGPGEVLSSRSVTDVVGEARGLAYVERGPVELKGFIEPVPVVQVTGGAGQDGHDENRAAAPGAEAPGLQTALPIGTFLGSLPSASIAAREEEIAAIEGAIDAVSGGTGRMLMLSGPHGIGKTRLAQEATLLAHQRGFLVAAGSCYEDQQPTDFFPFVAALGMAYAAAPASIRFAVRRRWPDLARLGVEPSSRPPGHPATPDESGEHVIQAATGFLTALTQDRPVALLLDNLQWADETSLRLLVHLARQTRDRRALILATCQDGEPHASPALDRLTRDLGRDRLLERIALRRLPPEGTAAMVAATIGDMKATQDFEDFVHRRTKGVPLYVEQILRSLGGHYRLVRQIGAGGMGRVFQAVDTRTGAQVAAKIMFAGREAGPEVERRFQQEGAVLAELQHPNIVRVHGTFMEEHASCIVMELLEGRSLGELLRLGDFESLKTADRLARTRHIAEQTASALAFAHRRGIIHRDVKPDNIMIVGDDEVKVTDFGIARVIRPEATLQTMTSTGVTLGTPLYMAPEQIEGKDIDGRADVYALGAVLYQMVTGRPPFEGADPLTIAFKHVSETPRPPAEINGDVLPDWEALILKALAKDPAQRFSGAGAMGRAITQLTIPEVEEQSPPAHRNRRLIGISAAAGAAVLIAGALVFATLGQGGHSTARAAIGAVVPNWGMQPKIGRFSYPYGVAADRQGNVYVSDQLANRIVKLSPEGLPLTTWGSAGTGLGQFSQAGPVAVDSSGDIFVLDLQANRVEEFGPDGTAGATYGGTGSGRGRLNGATGLAVDGRGHIYVADTSNHRIEEFFTSGAPPRTLTTMPQPVNQPSGPTGIATDSAGRIYVSATQLSDIRVLSASGRLLRTISGPGTGAGRLAGPGQIAVDVNGKHVYVFDQGSRLQEFSASGQLRRVLAPAKGPGAFTTATSMAVDPHGTLYVVDAGQNRIEKLLLNATSFVPVRVGRPPTLSQPSGIAVDGKGFVYAADFGHSRIWELSSAGRLLEVLAVDGKGSGALSSPNAVAAGPSGAVYVADTGNSRIAVYDPPTGRWSTFGGTSLSLNAPYGVAVDGHGNVYIADTGNQAIDEVSPEGKLLHQWGAGGGSAGTAPGQFHQPYGLAVDTDGDLFVVDEDNNRVQELPAGAQTWTVLSTGSLQLNTPTGIAIDGHGNIDIVDSLNNRIVELSSSGGVLGAVSGSGSNRLNGPTAIALDGSGNAYVTDTGNNRIAKFAPKP